MFGLSVIEKNSKNLHMMYDQINQLDQKRDDLLEGGIVTEEITEIEAEKKRLKDEINAFIENEYSFSVFEKYSSKKPTLIRLKTNEEIQWEDAFNEDFNEVSKSLRHSLVGLIEGDGRYKFK